MRALIRLLAAALVLATSACVSTPTPAELRRNVMQPTGTPAPPAGPIPDPRDVREIEGEGFRLAAGSAFQRLDLRSTNGEPMLVLRRASRVPALPIQVAVLREPNPQQDVVEQSYALEVGKRTLGESTDISRSDLTWPDAKRAILLQWTQNVPTATDAEVSTRYWQLNTQVSDTLILIVVGFAPAAEFDDTEVGDIVRTFRISD